MIFIVCEFAWPSIQSGTLKKHLHFVSCPVLRITPVCIKPGCNTCDSKFCMDMGCSDTKIVSAGLLALQASSALEDLRCFFTKEPFTKTILGLPLTYTLNPKTKKVEYVEAGLDLVSQDAVRYLGVTKTLAGDPIQAFLPLYLSYEHFEQVKVHKLPCPAVS